MSNKQKMRQEVLEGKPVTAFEMIDIHTHMGLYHNFAIPEHTAAHMVHAMDRVGIKCCVTAAHAGITADYRMGNDQVLQAMREFPGRFVGYCCVNPNYPAREMKDELKRCFAGGMTAIKLHPGLHGCPVDGEGYRPAWEYAEKHGAVVLTHTDASANSGVVPTSRCAERYPNATVLFGHSGFGHKGARACLEVAEKCPNAYFDLAASLAELDLVEALVAGVGADRVLFGTDLPFLDCRMQIGRMAFSRLADDEMGKVLSGNARRLFGI